MKRHLLLSPDPAEGNAPADDSTGAPPPVAKAVTESKARPEDAAELARLKRERDEEAKLRKEREMRINELEDENRQLKAVPAAPAPKARRSPGWLDMYRTPSGDESEA